MLYAFIITLLLIAIGFLVILKRSGTITIKPLEKAKKKQDWTKASHVWETSSQKGIFYCNVNFQNHLSI